MGNEHPNNYSQSETVVHYRDGRAVAIGDKVEYTDCNGTIHTGTVLNISSPAKGVLVELDGSKHRISFWAVSLTRVPVETWEDCDEFRIVRADSYPYTKIQRRVIK